MDIEVELENYLGEKRALIDAITREFRDGTPAKAIAVRVAGAFSRDQVTQYLSAVALHDSARKALQEADLAHAFDVRVTGIDAPREARIQVAADLAETPDYADLASRARAAFRDFHLTLDVTKDLPRGEDDRITDAFLDEMLLDGEPVRLVKATPRT
ncbi:hypothetical protein [Streptomyces spectabilis]|uniref:Uncharacterized protein n=1 Tax=Streptomyces spectabilis TaxID=68270 RepID=A0A7W8EZC1_STRST|nr:hypothetical protein [Streptomyces spectabilis]MBB5109004.1 hypothetical protein [Streptomyces spectabilis]GGV50611.1 hypothetical protein GCM10010245_79780 [Streptomyces spectabilis]